MTTKNFCGILERRKKGGETEITHIKLDYSLKTPEERNELVKKIIDETPPEQLTNRYLELLSNYLTFPSNAKERQILTENRMVTINKRETSFQGLVAKFENGEDGIYNLITNDKNMILTPKVSITEQDLQEIPALRELRDAIEHVEAQLKTATGRRRFLLKKQVIQMRQDQYVIKNSYRQTMPYMNVTKNFSHIDLDETITVHEDGTITSNGLVSLFNPRHVSILLCNYSKLKEDSYGKFWSDAYFLMEDLDNLVEKTLRDKYPFYYDLLIFKIDGKTNIEIQALLKEKYGYTYTVEYLSSLWRQKIPKLLAERAQTDYIVWYYTYKERGKWKKCRRCGQVKLADNRFFSRNKASPDGFYSICKECRNGRVGKNVKGS